MYSQLILLAILMTIISGRLIGTKISFGKQVMASVFSVIITTVVYWYTFLRDHPSEEFGMDGVIWLISMVVVSMLFYLMFEMFDPVKLGQRGDRLTDKRNPFSRMAAWGRRQKRYMQVFFTAVRYGVGKHLTVRRTPESDRKLAVALRKTLERCGGLFIKFGQVLSTRSDLLPEPIIEQLSHLQENVTRLTDEQVEAILARELPQPKEDLFRSFDMQPLAAASIGQVHRAVLKDGNREVVVKLQRPDISANIMRDMDILVRFATWASEKSDWARNIGLLELAKGFAAAMQEEIDFRIEARNFAQVTASLEHSRAKVKIPKVYQELSSSRLLVIEYLDGVSVKKGAALLRELNIDRQEVQRQLFDCVLEQIFFKGIFHADPHPGNVYILRDGTPALLDFGSVGRLGALQQDALKRLLVGFERKSSYLIMDALLQLTQPRQELDKEALEQAISQLLIQTSYAPSGGGSEAFVQNLFGVIADFELSFFPMVAGAFRSLITLEGTMLQLNPEFDLMEEARRFAQKYAADFMNAGSVTDLKQTATNELISMLPVIRRLPRRLDNIGSMLEKGDFTMKVGFFSDKENASFISRMMAQILLTLIGMAFGGIAIGLLSLAGASPAGAGRYYEMFGYVSLLISAVLLIRVAIHAVRSLKKS